MKTGLLLLLLLPRVAPAQAIAWLDRNFKNPITVTKTNVAAPLSHNVFPVYTTDLDTIIGLLENLARSLDTGTPKETKTQLLQAGHSLLAVTTEHSGGSGIYTIYLTTRLENKGLSLAIVPHGTNNKKAVQNLLLLLQYLKNNRPFVGT